VKGGGAGRGGGGGGGTERSLDRGRLGDADAIPLIALVSRSFPRRIAVRRGSHLPPCHPAPSPGYLAGCVAITPPDERRRFTTPRARARARARGASGPRTWHHARAQRLEYPPPPPSPLRSAAAVSPIYSAGDVSPLLSTSIPAIRSRWSPIVSVAVP